MSRAPVGTVFLGGSALLLATGVLGYALVRAMQVTPIEEFQLDSTEAVVLECDGDDIAFHFALP